MDKIKTENIPVVIDADGLWHLTNNPLIIKGYKRAVLTPNAVEFSRLVHSVLKRPDVAPAVHPDPALVAEVANALGGVTIVHKGSVDVISNGKFTEYVSDDGCPRRYAIIYYATLFRKTFFCVFRQNVMSAMLGSKKKRTRFGYSRSPGQFDSVHQGRFHKT